jgi:hypothetical protein
MNTLLVCRDPQPRYSLCSPPVLSTEKRKAEAERIRQKYPDRIPVCALRQLSFGVILMHFVWLGYLRESRPNRYPDDRQEEVPRSICALQTRHCSGLADGH